MNITPAVQQELWAKAGVSQISDIAGFPLPSHAALRASVQDGTVRLGIEYAAARSLVRITKSPGAVLLILVLSLVPPVLVVGSLVLAVATRNWWALGGILSAFLGHALANAYFPVKSLWKLFGAGALFHIFLTGSVVRGAAWVSFCFLMSAVALWTLNRLAWSWAYKAVLASEPFAAHLFKTHNLHIRDHLGHMHDAQQKTQP